MSNHIGSYEQSPMQYVHEVWWWSAWTYLTLCFQALNEALDSSSVPLEIVDGFINQISVSVPWTNLIQSSTEMEIQGLEITVQPKQRMENGGQNSQYNTHVIFTLLWNYIFVIVTIYSRLFEISVIDEKFHVNICKSSIKTKWILPWSEKLWYML